jgi:DNA polymerase-3 subunit alpha
MIVTKTIKTTKRNDIMAFIELEDLYGTIEIIVFPQLLQKYNHILNEDNIIYIKGSLSIKEDENAKLIAREIKDINNSSKFEQNKSKYNYNTNNNSNYNNNAKTGLYLKVDSFNNKQLTDKIVEIAKQHLGKENVFLYSEDAKQLYKWNGLNVEITNKLILELEEILPKQNIKVKN